MKTLRHLSLAQFHCFSDGSCKLLRRCGFMTGCCSLIVSLLLTGCAEVRPWERGVLAKPHMASEPAPLPNLMRDHNYSSREAGSTSTIGGGGGCGCY